MQFHASTYQLLNVINRKRKRIPKHALEKFWALASNVLKFGGLVSHVIFSMPVHRETLKKLPIIDVILPLPKTVKLPSSRLILTSLMDLVKVYLQQDQDKVKLAIPKIVEFGKISFFAFRNNTCNKTHQNVRSGCDMQYSTYQFLNVINRKRKRIPKHALEKFWALASNVLKFGGLVSHDIFSRSVHGEMPNKFRTIKFVLLLSEHI